MKLLNVHFTELAEGEERFDTLVSPCGTVAVLNEIARQNKVDHTGYDAAFPNPAEVKAAILEDVEATLTSDEKPVILFSTLVYNAEATLALAGELKREFSERVHLVLGGQLVPFAAEAYKRNKDIDVVAIGDGEVLVPQIIRDIENGTVKKTYTDWLANHPTERGQFAFVNYDEYHKIRERMRAQKESSGFSQLCVQGLGGPGCSWAANNKNGACDFCALQNIEEMNTRSLGEQMEVEARLQTEFSPDRFFDVANQFLPFLNPRQNAKWLRAYIKERNKRGVTTPKYAYLTVASIDETIAPLLKTQRSGN